MIPRAVDWFTGEALQYEQIEDEFENEGLDDDEDEDEDEDDLSEDQEDEDDSEDAVSLTFFCSEKALTRTPGKLVEA